MYIVCTCILRHAIRDCVRNIWYADTQRERISKKNRERQDGIEEKERKKKAFQKYFSRRSYQKKMLSENFFFSVVHWVYHNFNYTFDWLCLHWILSINRVVLEQRKEHSVFRNTHRRRTNKQFHISSDQAERFILCTCFVKCSPFFPLSLVYFTPTLPHSLSVSVYYSDCVCSILVCEEKKTEATFWFKLRYISIIE